MTDRRLAFATNMVSRRVHGEYMAQRASEQASAYRAFPRSAGSGCGKLVCGGECKSTADWGNGVFAGLWEV
jgi:hypothetical protein